MGIRPNGDGAAPPVTPDNPETRYSDWLTDLEDSGEIVGGVWQETDAKATSANSGTSDLAGRVAALENRRLPFPSMMFTAVQGAPSGSTLIRSVFEPVGAMPEGWRFHSSTNDILLLPTGGYVVSVIAESTDPIRLTHYRGSSPNVEMVIDPVDSRAFSRTFTVPIINESSGHGVLLRGVPTVAGRSHVMSVQRVA